MKTGLARLIGVLSVALAIHTQIMAQSGTYFINNYNPAEYNFDNSNYELLQDKRGVMHIANRQGILHYDGNSWWLTATPFSIFCLGESNGKMYVGGREGLGVINRTSSGDSEFVNIDSLRRDIIKCVVLKERVYYMNRKRLFSFRLHHPSEIDTIATDPQEMLDLVVVKEKVYLTTSAGLKEVRDLSLVEPGINKPEGSYFIRESPGGIILHLTDSSNLYTETDGDLNRLAFDNQSFLEEHSVTEIAWVSDTLVAISTLSGGIIFVDVPSGKTEKLIDYESGLPDNEIITIYTDKSGGFWAVHPFGLSVISPGLPLRSFSHYPGLKGSLVSVIFYEDRLFVGTTLGVYRLTEVQNLRKSTVIDRVRVRVDDKNAGEVVKKKSLFGLFKKKNRSSSVPDKLDSVPQKYKYVYRERTIEEIISKHYEFVKIKGIHSKSVQLLAYQDQLLSGTAHGVYRIQGDTAYLEEAVPVSYMFGLPDDNLLFVSTIDKEVKALTYNGKKWHETNQLEGLNDYIDQITLDPEQNVWLCGADSLYRLQMDGANLNDVEVYKIENPHFDRVYATNYKDKIHFINSSGYFAYENRQIVRQDEIEKEIGLAKKYVLGKSGELWINTGSSWYGAENDIKKTLNFLSLFKDPQSVAIDKTDNFWVVTASNNLFKINIKDVDNIASDESIYLKEVRSNDEKIPLRPELEVEQEKGSLTFEFASPDYSGIYTKEYQFRLSNTSGTQTPWSNWAVSNKVISYQFLPPGSYVLEARSRNALGKIIVASPFNFEIVPPYWKRPWFYVIELLFFGSLLAFTFYLNRGKGKFSFVSRLLGFLTLILIVEFFQTVAEYKFETNESPVINFFIQAFIALLILPVEGLLRRLLTSKPEDLAKPKAKF
jgi:hypothetical protein